MKDVLKKKNVIGYSRKLQPKIYEKEGAVDESQRVVRFYVTKKLPPDQLDKKDLIPDKIRVGLKRYKTDVVEVGEVEPLVFTDRVRPLQVGYSVGHYMVSAGTIGGFVFDRGGNIYILSNNHVLADSSMDNGWKARIGEPVLQPGTYDGGVYRVDDAGDTVGVLYKYIPLKRTGVNYVDAAVALLLHDELLSENPYTDYAVDDEIYDGMLLEYFGRSSGLKRVSVIDTSAVISVRFGDAILRFDDQIIFKPNPIPGDSGSVLYSPETKKAVGLLFAGSKYIGVANKMWRVVEEFRAVGLELSLKPPRKYLEPPAELLAAYLVNQLGDKINEVTDKCAQVAEVDCKRKFRGFIVFMHIKVDGTPINNYIFPVECNHLGIQSVSLTLDVSIFSKGQYVMKVYLFNYSMTKPYGAVSWQYRVK